LTQLWELATPDLYRRNAFRMLGLDDSIPAGLLPLEEPPAPAELQLAQQRIQDPLARLIEEFFWFWPQREGETDEALQWLREGKLEEATRLFREREEQAKDLAASHNLAILDHLTALEHERRGELVVLAADVQAARDAAWRDSFQRWRRVLEDDRTWAHLRARIAEIDDPRLTPDCVPSLRESLEDALLLVSARLALQAAERNTPGDTARHFEILRISGFSPERVQQALRRSLAPIDQRIRAACEKGDRSADADPSSGLKVANGLLMDSAASLRAIDLMLPADDSLWQGLQDELARIALRCIAAYANQTADWVGAKRVLGSILRQLRPSLSLRQRLEESLQLLTESAETNTCHYCGLRPGAANCAHEVDMYGEVQTLPAGIGPARFAWRHIKLKVPCCTECKGHHVDHSRRLSEFGWGGCLGPVGVFFAIYYATNTTPMPGELHAALNLAAFVAPVTLLYYWTQRQESEANRLFPAGVKQRSEYESYAPIVAYQAKGWEFGTGPGGAAAPVPSSAPVSARSAAGCQKCGTEHWWQSDQCGLCDAPRTTPDEADLDGSLQVMIKILGLGPRVMAQVVAAIETGNRGTAAALLLGSGQSAAETRQIILGWERRPKKD